MPGESPLQPLDTRALGRRDLNDRITDVPVDGAQFVQARACLFIDQVGLVENQARWHATEFRGHEIAVEELARRYRQWSKHEKKLIKVGGNRFQLAVTVRSPDDVGTRVQCHDHAVPLVPSRLPAHMIADDDLLKAGAEVTAMVPPIVAADFHLATMVCRDETGTGIGEIGRHIGFLRR